MAQVGVARRASGDEGDARVWVGVEDRVARRGVGGRQRRVGVHGENHVRPRAGELEEVEVERGVG